LLFLTKIHSYRILKLSVFFKYAQQNIRYGAADIFSFLRLYLSIAILSKYTKKDLMLESNLEVQTKNILNSNHFHSITRLGKGGFGHVLLATKATSSSTFYAVKCISKKKMIKDPLLKKFFFQEINTMASLDHPNIVKLHKTFECNN